MLKKSLIKSYQNETLFFVLYLNIYDFTFVNTDDIERNFWLWQYQKPITAESTVSHFLCVVHFVKSASKKSLIACYRILIKLRLTGEIA